MKRFRFLPCLMSLVPTQFKALDQRLADDGGCRSICKMNGKWVLVLTGDATLSCQFYSFEESVRKGG